MAALDINFCPSLRQVSNSKAKPTQPARYNIFFRESLSHVIATVILAPYVAANGGS